MSVLVEQESSWTEVTLEELGIEIDRAKASQYIDFFGEIISFCSGFQAANYFIEWENCGYYRVIYSCKFRHEEDAMAFKLRFAE